jgi:hypothetical protein
MIKINHYKKSLASFADYVNSGRPMRIIICIALTGILNN